MDSAALIDRIDWPATGLLLAGILGVILVPFLLWRRRPALPAALPGDTEADLRELRQSVHEELGALRAELAELRQEVGRIKAAGGVAPQYGEAMTLADRGASALDIAARCGISLAEAELVRALGKKTRD